MKKLLVLVSLLFLALFLIGCACDPIANEGVNLVEAQDKCADDSNPDHCYKKLAKNSLNPKVCDFINRDGTKGKCLIEVALSINDPGICSKVGGYYTEEQCLYELAKEMNDVSLCNNIDENYVHGGDDITGVFTKSDCFRVAEGKTKEKLCGFMGAPCCDGYVCNDVGCSISYRCEPCGEVGLPCCFSDYGMMGCDGTLKCTDKGTCVED